MIAYIYKKTIIKTGKSYIGKHNGRNKKYIGSGTLYLIDFKKYVKNRECDLKEEILEYVDDITKLNEREVYWLKKVDAENNNNFYNMTNKSYGVRGNKLSEETKEKISKSKMGTPA